MQLSDGFQLEAVRPFFFWPLKNKIVVPWSLVWYNIISNETILLEETGRGIWPEYVSLYSGAQLVMERALLNFFAASAVI